jgi:hypothetical protein
MAWAFPRKVYRGEPITTTGQRGAFLNGSRSELVEREPPHGKLMVTVLGGLAEFERELIRARTGEGRKRAKERGVRFGRPRKLIDQVATYGFPYSGVLSSSGNCTFGNVTSLIGMKDDTRFLQMSTPTQPG